VVLEHPACKPTVTVWKDEEYDFVMVFTGDTLEPDRRRRGLAIEPMTCAPDAFRTGTGLSVLEPGQRTTAVWVWRWRRGRSPEVSRRLAGTVVLRSDETSDVLTPEEAQDVGRRPAGRFLQDSRHEA
jgi:hypothetical protein